MGYYLQAGGGNENDTTAHRLLWQIAGRYRVTVETHASGGIPFRVRPVPRYAEPVESRKPKRKRLYGP
jgi:hypothetical protein